ncbi:MAG: RDD family protein [Bacteroidetes bacterium]|nr:RDD family protein [Bacteroidota bacterium]
MANTIEITTTQHVTIEYELASLRERLLAWVLDVLAYAFLAYLCLYMIGSILRWQGDGSAEFYFILIALGLFVYFILFEIWNRGQTPGKRAVGIKVVRLDGKEPEWGDIVLRSVLYLMDAFFSLGVLGAILIKTSPKAQRLGDMAANTALIRLSSTQNNYRLDEILNISSLQTYTPVYPQVNNLTERDMLFIKTVLNRYAKYPNAAHEAVVIDLVYHLVPILKLEQAPADKIAFLKTLLRDYVVLTR